MSLRELFKELQKGKADGGALFIVTTCMSIICLGMAFVGGNLPAKFPKANPNIAAIDATITNTTGKNTLQLVMLKPKPALLIPTIDPKAPPLSTDKTPPGASSSGSTGCTPAGPNDPEPPNDYTRTTYGGKTVNQRTKVMLQTAERYASGFGVSTPFTLSQGSYNPGGVAASAGTHDGGGAGDISVSGMDTTQINNAVKALRMAGFAAWYRTPAEGFQVHIHFMAIGDSEESPTGADQVPSYLSGRNGLADNGPDTAPASVGRPVPAWASKYGTCT